LAIGGPWVHRSGLAEATLDAIAAIETVASGTRFQESTMDDDDLMWSAGVLYRDDRWGFGASYRSKATFDIDSVEFDGRQRENAQR
jgi:long-subunit fatty acid transport protein